MQCPNEFTQSLYADGELPENEAREFIAHLEVCVDCRTMVSALKAENRMLIESLQDMRGLASDYEPAGAGAEGLRGIGLLAAAFTAAAFLIRVASEFALDVELPSQLDWLNPFSWSGLVNWTVNGFFFIIGEGGSMLTSQIRGVSFAVLSLLGLAVVLAAAQKLKRSAAIGGLIAFLVVCVVPGYAIDVRTMQQGQVAVTVAANETVDDTLVVFGESVTINGTVTGDLVAFARQVNVLGKVHGNLVGFAQRIRVTGSVEGDIIGFGQSVQLNGPVGGSVWGFGQAVEIGTGGRTELDATLFGADLNVAGDIGRDLTVFGATLDAGGRIGRDLRFRGGRVLLQPPAAVGRDLNVRVRSQKAVQIDAGVIVTGKKNVEIEQPEPSQFTRIGFYVKEALRIGAAFIAGLLLFWVYPGMGRVSLSPGRVLLTSGGIGFLAACATPIAVVILALTLVGIPIALVLLALWLLGLYLSKIIIGRCLGAAIFGPRDGGMASTALTLITGLFVITIVVNLPYIGGVFKFLFVLAGLGALVITACRDFMAGRKSGQAGDAVL